jgi:hypothetical protein
MPHHTIVTVMLVTAVAGVTVVDGGMVDGDTIIGKRDHGGRHDTDRDHRTFGGRYGPCSNSSRWYFSSNLHGLVVVIDLELRRRTR